MGIGIVRTTFSVRAALCLCTLVGAPGGALAQRDNRPSNADRHFGGSVVVRLSAPRVVSVEPSASSATIIQIDAATLRDVHDRRVPVRVERFPVGAEQTVELQLEPFSIAGPDTRFVVGRLNGTDRPFDYDTTRISMFRGRVVGHPGSHVYLSLSGNASTGYIDLGSGAERYRISSRGGDGRVLGPNLLSVFQARAGSGSVADVPLCGVKGDQLQYRGEWIDSPVTSSVLGVASTNLSTPRVGLKHLELAVETDYELFTLFDDATATFDYVVQMYGEVSAIFMRDVDTRFEVVFVRVWDTADDLFNGPDPLFQFRPYWNANMGAVQRDTAQFFSGRRDFPFGGQAFLSALCGSNGYGIVGYAVGSFPTPTLPSPFNWDVSVTTHELGHSCGTNHTHANGLDTCDNSSTTPQRGPIMSYCGQTWSGMNSNTDNYFHRVSQASMDANISISGCIVDDCNMNNVADSIDIAQSVSPDTNGNGVPDECEDCDANGTLDPADIAGGAQDLNGNGVPDRCETDCNNNNIPDDREILLNNSLDRYGNDVLDVCETDCNNNGTSDYTEIQADMTLDKDRNAMLDSCQDCDNDGTSDLLMLAGAHHLWVTTGQTGEVIRQFYGSTGVLTDISIVGAAASVNAGQDLIVRSDKSVLVTSSTDDRVMLFNPAGDYVSDFVSPGAGGVDYPTGLIISPSGQLLVSSRNTNSVLAYNGTTGASEGVMISAGLGGLLRPFGLTYGPNGNLFVTSDSNEVVEYDGSTGAFVRLFVTASNNGGLSQPRGLAFKPDGNLLVASFGTDEVLEFVGTSGVPRGKWAHVGTETRITQDSPWGIRIAPNGHVFVSRTGTAFSSVPSSSQNDVAASHLTDARMFEYDVCTGDFRKTEIGGNDHGLNFATGFDFVPGFDVDCNVNERPDNCDIASGASLDGNSDGIPDECQIDCNGNGTYDRLDLYPFGSSLDCNCNFIPDECDLTAGTSFDCNGNGTPDECEINFDCNNNGTQDMCEIFQGTASDCNSNGVIDVCEPGTDGVAMSVDFDAGLPTGWTTSGIFSVNGNCSGAGAGVCGGSLWAYAGNSGSCTYGDAEAGSLVSPPIDLPPGRPELRFCTAYTTELNFDFADVVVNNVIMERLHGGTGVWENHTIDLTQFAGQSIQIMFRIQSDSSVSGTLGWLVDNVEIIAPVDICACAPSSQPALEEILTGAGQLVPMRTMRMIGVRASSADAGRSQAIRITATSLAPPFDVWNGQSMWVGQPTSYSELPGRGFDTPGAAAGEDTFLSAQLQCTPMYTDWTLLGNQTVWIRDPFIVPSAIQVGGGGLSAPSVYAVQLVDELCSVGDENSFSIVAPITSAGWGDVGELSGGVARAVNDTVSVEELVFIQQKFSGLGGAANSGGRPIKARTDMLGVFAGPSSTLDGVISVAELTAIADAFGGVTFPFAPASPTVCP